MYCTHINKLCRAPKVQLFYFYKFASLINPSKIKNNNQALDSPKIGMLVILASFGLVIQVTRVELRAKDILWDEVRSYWEHVGEHIGNLMGNNKSPTPPTNPQEKKTCPPWVHAASPHCLQEIILLGGKKIHFLDIEFIPYELSSRKKFLFFP